MGCRGFSCRNSISIFWKFRDSNFLFLSLSMTLLLFYFFLLLLCCLLLSICLSNPFTFTFSLNVSQRSLPCFVILVWSIILSNHVRQEAGTFLVFTIVCWELALYLLGHTMYFVTYRRRYFLCYSAIVNKNYSTSGSGTFPPLPQS